MSLDELIASPEDRRRFDQIAARYGVSSILVFGSVARGEDSAASDLDLLVSFKAGCHPGWLIFDLQGELEGLFGRKIDLSTEAMWKEPRLTRVIREAEAIYGGT